MLCFSFNHCKSWFHQTEANFVCIGKSIAILKFDHLRGRMYLVSYCYTDLWAGVLLCPSIDNCNPVKQFDPYSPCSDILTDDGDLRFVIFFHIGATGEELGRISYKSIQRKPEFQ